MNNTILQSCYLIKRAAVSLILVISKTISVATFISNL